MAINKRPVCLGLVVPVLAALSLFLTFPPTPLAFAGDRTVKVGVFEAKPYIFTEASGKAAGIFVDVLEHIAKSEGWQLSYVPGTWAEGLERLENGDIDLVTTATITAEREKRFAFNKAPVTITWSMIYTRKGSGIVSMPDLKGKRITVVAGSIHEEGFIRFSQGFDLGITLIPVPDRITLFSMVAKGESDAAIANNFTGLEYRKRYELDKTAIMFNALEDHYAAAKNDPKGLLTAIDRHLAAMKGDPLSVYFAALKRWQPEENEFAIPAWLWSLGFVILGCLFLSLAGAAVLRRQVALRTREFRESEEKYRSLVDNLNVGIARITTDGRFLEVNPALIGMLGYADREEFFRLAVPETYQDPAERNAYLREMRQHGHVRNRELRLRKKEGSSIWVSLTADAQFDERGEIRWMDTVVEDITEIKKAADVLRESERRLADIIEFLPVATFVIDREGEVVVWNKAIEEMTGIPAAGMIGRGNYEYALPFYGQRRPILVDLVLSPPAEADRVTGEKYTSVQWKEALLTGEAMVRLPTGENRVMQGWAHPVFNASGETTGAIESISDITDKKRAVELRLAKDVAEAASRAKSLFLANMSHEIRTPLNAILGFSQIMRHDRGLTPHQQEQLDIINRSGEHLLGLINGILEISKIEAGRTVLVPADFDLRAMIGDLKTMFAGKAEAKGVALTTEIAGDVPPCIRGDEGKLRQIYLNLLGNALKFTEKGAVSLRVSRLRGEDGRLRLASEIQDTGPGIDAEEKDRLFRCFEQTASGVRSGGGTGLGLAISRQYALLMGGDIAVESEPGVGSLFRFVVDIETGNEKGMVKAAPSTVTGIRSGEDRNRVLIVDDNEDNRQVLVQMLRRVGFETDEAGDGAAAVEKFAAWRPHLVLMDMRMPVMDGFEATRRIKAMEGGKGPPVIALTASVFDGDRKEILATHVDAHIGKPFRENELFGAIHTVLGIEFIYAEDEPAQAATPQSVAGPAPEAIAALPPDLVAGLRQAVRAADFDAMLASIDAIAGHDGKTAAILRNLARIYNYDTLLQVLTPGE